MSWLRAIPFLFTLLAFVLQPASASAFGNAHPQARVSAFQLVAMASVGASAETSPGLHEGIAEAYDENASGYRFAARGSGPAHNAANAVRLRHQLASQEIAGGHAFGKHVVKRGEFRDLGISTREQFASHVEGIMNNPSATRSLRGGRTAFWDDATGTVVIRHPSAADGGTAFRPVDGRAYFEGLR